MARRIHCYIAADGKNAIKDEEWEQIRRLQHWYSSEFIWTAGKPALKMFAVFPNFDHPLADDNTLLEYISRRWVDMRKMGLNENNILRKMREEKLVLLKEGGYHEGCLVSGSVRVADNEWNAYLFTEFIAKASMLAPSATFEVHDEGEFIKWRPVYFKEGDVYIYVRTDSQYKRISQLVEANGLFAIIDATKYDDHPDYRTSVTNFHRMQVTQKRDVLRNWNWHGYDSILKNSQNPEIFYDLNNKVKEIRISII